MELFRCSAEAAVPLIRAVYGFYYASKYGTRHSRTIPLLRAGRKSEMSMFFLNKLLRLYLKIGHDRFFPNFLLIRHS